MTEEYKQKTEIDIKAEKYIKGNVCHRCISKNSCTVHFVKDCYGRIYIDGYRQAQADIKMELTEKDKQILELKTIIENNEYYQNGYKAGQHDEWVKSEQKIFEAEGKSELRDVRIFDLKKKVEEKDKQIEKLEGQVTRAFEVLESKRKRIEELEAQIEYWKSEYDKLFNEKE